MVRHCKEQLNDLGSQNEVTVLWVPAHEGIEGNDKADELAREAARRRFTGPEPFFGVSKDARKKVVKEWLHREHTKAWMNYEGGRHTKIFCRAPSNDFSNELLNLSRKNVKRKPIHGYCSATHIVGVYDSTTELLVCIRA